MCHLNKDEPIDVEAISKLNKAVVGEPAPGFTLLSDEGKEVSLSDYLGKKVILFFYPKDNTAGCTVEALSFEENLEKLNESGYEVIGISRDSISSHQKFKTSKNLTYTLLSDPDEVACRAYGVMKMKNMYGRKYLGIERSTFVINESGILTNEFRKVTPKDHLEKLKKALGI